MNKRTDPKDDDQEIEWVSKTQIKQEAEELKALGRQIVDLGEKDLAKIPMDETLAEAIDTARRIKGKHEAFRRQMQYVGKQMRHAEVDAIREALDHVQNKHNRAAVELGRLEVVRDQLIAEGDSKINELMGEYPDLDRQRLRQWIRQASKDQKQGKPSKAAKDLFQYLKEVMLPV